MTTHTNELAAAAGRIVLAFAAGDRLEAAKQIEGATRNGQAFDLFEAVCSVAIECAHAMYGDEWAAQMSYAVLDIETRDDDPADAG